MADPVTDITHWRRSRDQHTREVIKQELPEGAIAALIMMADRIERLERVIAVLAAEAERED